MGFIPLKRIGLVGNPRVIVIMDSIPYDEWNGGLNK